MKEFDIERAKYGDQICTRCGYEAFITDFTGELSWNKNCPILAISPMFHGYTEVFYENGRFDLDEETDFDLMMLEKNDILKEC